MSGRLDYFQKKPELISALRRLTKEQEAFSLDAGLRALVELRVSQINGCAYCIDHHACEARALGVDQQLLDALPAWRESDLFSASEKAALAWGESLTRIAETHAGDVEYADVMAHFTETQVVELGLAVSLANFWNRMAGGFRKPVLKRAPAAI